jgi:hypothetical protein
VDNGRLEIAGHPGAPPFTSNPSTWTTQAAYEVALYFDAQRHPDLRADWEDLTGRRFPMAGAAGGSVAEEKTRIATRREAERQLSAEDASRTFRGFGGGSLRLALAQPRPKVPWIIEGLQRAGHKVTLVAQFKTGKTTLVANVVRALADGVPFLDRFEVPPLAGRIAVFDYELQSDDALDLYRHVGMTHDDRVSLQSLRGHGFTLANDFHAELTVTHLKKEEVEYWVLDPFGRAMRGFGEENSNDDVRGFMMRLDEIAMEAGVRGILLPVHTGRADVAAGSERARGASVLDDDPDVRWILTRSGRDRFFRAEGRAGVDVPEFALGFDPARSLLSATSGTRSNAQAERLKPEVAAFVQGAPGANVREIKAGVPGKDQSVKGALDLLVAEGVVGVVVDGAAMRHYMAADLPHLSEARGPTEAERGPASNGEPRPEARPVRGGLAASQTEGPITEEQP